MKMESLVRTELLRIRINREREMISVEEAFNDGIDILFDHYPRDSFLLKEVIENKFTVPQMIEAVRKKEDYMNNKPDGVHTDLPTDPKPNSDPFANTENDIRKKYEEETGENVAVLYAHVAGPTWEYVKYLEKKLEKYQTQPASPYDG